MNNDFETYVSEAFYGFLRDVDVDSGSYKT